MGLRILPYDMKVDFVGFRKIAYIISSLLILIGIAGLIYHGGIQYGIDFAGGATVQIKFAQPVADEDLKASLAGADLPGLAVQQYGTDGTSYLLRLSAVDETAEGISGLIREALAAGLKNVSYEIQRLEMVGPKVGADLRGQAVQALYLSILLTAVYISGRFERRWFTALFMALALGAAMTGLGYFGVDKMYLTGIAILLTLILCRYLKLIFALGAMISMLHDVLITVGLFCLLGKEFDLTIIAAILTVVGYSLNDTIVVYDRIRENLHADTASPLGDIINRSINQTLSRTVLTSGTTLLVIVALLIFGGGIIHDFSLVMFIGVITGTLSSIFVASPVLLTFGQFIDREPPKKEDRRARDADGRLAPQV